MMRRNMKKDTMVYIQLLNLIMGRARAIGPWWRTYKWRESHVVVERRVKVRSSEIVVRAATILSRVVSGLDSYREYGREQCFVVRISPGFVGNMRKAVSH
jgi:hypothetical protein